MFNSREEVINSAQIPDSYNEFKAINLDAFYDRIYRFYDSDDKHITPYKYILESDGINSIIKTTMGGIMNEDLIVDNIKDTGKIFSNYSSEHLDRVGINEKDTWNGQNASISYSYNGTIQFAETDFYTCSLFSRLLHLESLNSQISEISEMTARKKYADDVDQFSDRPWFCTGGSIGGVIIGQTSQNEYEALVAKRSKDCFANPGRYSIVPNTNLNPQQLSEGLDKSIRKAFKDEVFNYRDEGKEFFDQNIEPINILNGWNLRDTKLTLNYMLLIENISAYEKLKNKAKLNAIELSQPISISLNDPKEVAKNINYNNMTPSVIPVLLESIRYLQKNEHAFNYNLEFNPM